MFKKFALFFLLILQFSSFYLFPQSNEIQGNLINHQNPIPFADIILFKNKDLSNPIAYDLADSLGQFKLKKISGDSLLLKIRALGYKEKLVNINFNNNTKIFLNNIEMEESVKELNNVVVVGQKLALQKLPNGISFDAKQNITQAGGTANDLLKNIPTILVDAEGGLTVRGKTPLILINGRTSGISNLNTILASSIEKIEVLNNPGAEYDADSDGGIINIILKKESKLGTNISGFIGAGKGIKERESGGITINHQDEKFNYAFEYDFKKSLRFRNISSNRLNSLDYINYQLLQNRHDDRIENSHNLRFNFDYLINSKNTINLELIQTLEGQTNDEFLNSSIFNKIGELNGKNLRESLELERESVTELDLNYEHLFKKPGNKIIINFASSIGKTTQNTNIKTKDLFTLSNNFGSIYNQKTNFKEIPNINSLRIDYENILSEKLKLIIGYKGILRSTKDNYQNLNELGNTFIINPLNSNLFNYNENIQAFYFNFESQGNQKIKYQIGLRAENVNNNGLSESYNTVNFKRNYFNLYPNLIIEIPAGQNNHFNLNYSRRINRPSLGQLNPFIDITDSLNTHGGNPYLSPEYINLGEIAHSMKGENWNLTSTAYYRYAKNTILAYTLIKPNNIAFLSPQNIGNTKTVGIEEIFDINILPIWNLNTSFSAYNMDLNGSIENNSIKNSVFSYYGKIINNFNLRNNVKIQLVANYESPTATTQGTRLGYKFVDIGIQKRILNNKASLGLVISDIFNTQRSGTTLIDSNFSQTRTYKVDTRAIFISFAYSLADIFKSTLIENKFSNN